MKNKLLSDPCLGTVSGQDVPWQGFLTWFSFGSDYIYAQGLGILQDCVQKGFSDWPIPEDSDFKSSMLPRMWFNSSW